jgi:hypothetical protein
MPAYNTIASSPKPSMHTGDQIALVNNAATDSSILATKQVSIAPHQGDSATYCTVFNGTNQAVQMQAAPSDSAALYVSIGSSISAGALATISCAVPWMRGLFATAPTTGSLIIYHG